jgi:hypothetical protein
MPASCRAVLEENSENRALAVELEGLLEHPLSSADATAAAQKNKAVFIFI